MAIVWCPKRWWDCCLSKDEKKEIDQMFIEVIKVCISSIQFGNIRTLDI